MCSGHRRTEEAATTPQPQDASGSKRISATGRPLGPPETPAGVSVHTAVPGAFGVRAVETHISVLFFLGDRVYKLRKPVHFDFLDFSSREEREADCHREVELNARFAKDVYLGVLDISDAGVLVDHLVVMRQLPPDRRLATLVKQTDARPQVHQVARLLVETDARSERSPKIDSVATRDAVRTNWQANFGSVEPFVGPVIDPDDESWLQAHVERFLAGRAALFDERIAAGRIRDGHGDLQAEDIFCLDDGPRILDCIEFDDRLRYGDVLADLAFLAMDLERLGHPELGAALLGDYEELSGDVLPRTLAAHYCASRAYVRAKVACLAAAEGATGAADTARALHRLARSFLERARVRLVLIGGLPGTGKSTLASALGDETGMVVLRSDEIRHELSGANDTEGPDGIQFRYSEEMTAATYSTLLARARDALARGQSVVLDASWIRESFRREARALAAETASELCELRCEVAAPVAIRRIAARRRRGSLSEADAGVARQMAANADPWPEAGTIDTSVSKKRSLSQARRLVT